MNQADIVIIFLGILAFMLLGWIYEVLVNDLKRRKKEKQESKNTEDTGKQHHNT